MHKTLTIGDLRALLDMYPNGMTIFINDDHPLFAVEAVDADDGTRLVFWDAAHVDPEG